jgi:hypothetical protein
MSSAVRNAVWHFCHTALRALDRRSNQGVSNTFGESVLNNNDLIKDEVMQLQPESSRLWLPSDAAMNKESGNDGITNDIVFYAVR